MGLDFGAIFKSKQRVPDSVKRYMQWDITPLGRQKVENYQGPTTPKFKVLAALSMLGPSNIEEIAKEASMGQHSVHYQLKQLKDAQCVRVMGGEGVQAGTQM